MRDLHTRIIALSAYGGGEPFKVPVRCIGAQWRFRSWDPVFSTIDGKPLQDTWGSDLFSATARIDFPIVYDCHGLPAPYIQDFVFFTPLTGVIGGSVTMIETQRPVSQLYKMVVRIVPLWGYGRSPFKLPIHCAAVSFRMNGYDIAGATVDGKLIQDTWASDNVGQTVFFDWPVVYDQQLRVVPYDMELSFNPAAQMILGSATFFDLVPV